MTGTRAMSGSAATRFRKRTIAALRVEHRLVHVDVDDLRAVLDLLARDSTAPRRSRRRGSSLRERARAGDVGALADVDEERVVADVERLEAREAHACARSSAPRAAAAPCTASAIARMCSGVVPQQPPTMLTKPLCANSREQARRLLGRLVVAGLATSDWAARRSDSTQTNVSATRASSSMYGRISAAPSAQLRPTASGLAWRTEFQNASGVWPESVRPEASVIVPETMTGSARPRSSKNSSIANSAALAFSVSKIVSTRSRSTPPSTSAARRLACRRRRARRT